jgi:hypothetical protein
VKGKHDFWTSTNLSDVHNPTINIGVCCVYGFIPYARLQLS